MSMNGATLIARKLFHDDDGSSKTVPCPAEKADGPQIVNFVGNIAFHSFATILAGACGIVSLLIVSVIIFLHATNYSSPVQQRQILRVLLLVPWVALFAFIIVWQEGTGQYLVESLDFGCAIALSAFLLLLCDYILSNPGGFDELFGEGAWKRGQFNQESPEWLKRTWYAVLQFLPTSIVIWLATVITVAANVYCATSNSPHFAHIWITVFKGIVTTIAIVAVLRFYGRMKTHLKQHNVFLKLFAFKGIIGLNALQTLIINILVGTNAIKPTKYMAYHDITIGLPSFLIALEMPIFAVLLFFAFPVAPYKSGPQSPAAGPLTALIQAFNLTDILSAFVRGPMRLVREQQWGIQRQHSMPLDANPGGVPLMQSAGAPYGGAPAEYGVMRGQGAHGNVSYDNYRAA